MNKSILKIRTISFLKFFLGKSFVNKLLAEKYINLYRKHKIIFIHIPKAAGTSIANVVYHKRNGHLKADYVKKKLGSKFEKKYSFSVTRNPYDRLYSAYRFATQGHTKDGAISNNRNYKTECFGTFESFINKWLVNQDLKKLDPVFQPQYLFVFNTKEELIVNQLFKLEELNSLESLLSKKMESKVVIKATNISKKTSTVEDVYTKDLKNKVYHLYRKDFELLKYEK